MSANHSPRRDSEGDHEEYRPTALLDKLMGSPLAPRGLCDVLMPALVSNLEQKASANRSQTENAEDRTQSVEDRQTVQERAQLPDYQEALKLGEVLVAYARVMMVGPGGVGKSSFLNGLMNQRLVEHAESTILADTKTVKPQFWANAGESAGSYWREVTDRDEIKELAGLLQLVTQAKSPPPCGSTGLETMVASAAVGEFNPRGYKPRVQSISDKHVSCIKDNEVQNVLQQVVEHTLSHSERQGVPHSEVLMHVWDCGGQPVFLDVLPAFLTSRTMFLLFFDARQNLLDKCSSLSHKAGRLVSKSEQSFTTLELLTQWMASIHAMLTRKGTLVGAFPTSSEIESLSTQENEAHASDSFDGKKDQQSSCTNVAGDIIPKFPRIIPVGTHGDEVQEKDKILSTLLSHCEGKAYIPLLQDGVIVDNTTAGCGKECEDKGFKYIRERVHQFASKHLAIPTPVAWVLFRKVLHNVAKTSPIVSYEQAVAVGQACGIAEDVAPSALNFYHELAVFLHYTEIKSLSNQVIADPQWLIKQLGKLLAPEGLQEKVSSKLYWEQLHKKGILVQPLYEEVWEESFLEPQALADLLEHFLLAAPINHKTAVSQIPGRKYFIPCVLQLSSQMVENRVESRNVNISPTPSLVTHLATTLHKYCIPCVSENNECATQFVKMSSPLHLTFSTQYVPPGFFTRLATTLTREPKCEPLFERVVYRNKITFTYGKFDEFTICEQSSSVEINVVRIQHRRSHEIMTFGNACYDIMELIQACSDTVSQWLPSVEVKAAFLCEQCPDFITIPRGADTGLNLHCKAGHHCNLTKEKQYWLKIPSTPEHLAQKGDLSDAELQRVALAVQRGGKLKELADELEIVFELESLRRDVNRPLTLLLRWHVEIKKNGLEAHSLLVHHLKCIGLTDTSHSLYYREFLSPPRTNPIADNSGAARGGGRVHERVASVDNTSATTRAARKSECSQPQNLEWENVDDTPLVEKDLLEITNYLQNMEKTHIYHLGLVLGLRHNKVKAMMDSAIFLNDVIAAWLQKEDQVIEKGEPSWTVLVNALKHPRVGQTGIAKNIGEDKGHML